METLVLSLGLVLELAEGFESVENVVRLFLPASILANLQPASLDQLIGQVGAILELSSTKVAARSRNGVEDGTLDRLADDEVAKVLSRLEGERLIAFTPQMGSSNVGEGEGSLSIGVVGASQDQSVATENALDVANKRFGHDGCNTRRSGKT